MERYAQPTSTKGTSQRAILGANPSTLTSEALINKIQLVRKKIETKIKMCPITFAPPTVSISINPKQTINHKENKQNGNIAMPEVKTMDPKCPLLFPRALSKSKTSIRQKNGMAALAIIVM